MQALERMWLTVGKMEHEFASLAGGHLYPTGQVRRRLPNGMYKNFTILDIRPSIALDEDTIELTDADLEEVRYASEPDDGIPIIVDEASFG